MTFIVDAPAGNEQAVVGTEGASQVDALGIPTDIYAFYENEATKTANAKENIDIFKQISLLNTLKSKVNILHEMLSRKSNVYIFGAGGTTSWFLPKLLKIFNDAFNKVPSLRYDLNIILIDNDIV